MTAKIINLRNARKQQKRAAKEVDAAANRTKFGRTGTQKKSDSIAELKAVKHLDDHKLNGDRKDAPSNE